MRKLQFAPTEDNNTAGCLETTILILLLAAIAVLCWWAWGYENKTEININRVSGSTIVVNGDTLVNDNVEDDTTRPLIFTSQKQLEDYIKEQNKK